MRTLRIIFFLVLTSFLEIHAQDVPYGISYQALALDAQGMPVVGIDPLGVPINEAQIFLRVSILDGTSSGQVLYEEVHEVLTDQYGMFTVTIGQGFMTGGVVTFSNIDWANSDKFLKTEIDIENDGNFTLTSIQQFFSVPFAFVAKNVLNNDDADADSTNEIQTISLNNGIVSLSNNGGSFSLPPDLVDDADADSTNELQNISISNDTIFLSKGGYVKLPQSLLVNQTSSVIDSVATIGDQNLYISNTYNTPELHYDTLYLAPYSQLLETGQILIYSGNGGVNSRFSVIDENGNILMALTATDNTTYNYSFATQSNYIVYKFENLGKQYNYHLGQQIFRRLKPTSQVFSQTTSSGNNSNQISNSKLNNLIFTVDGF